MAFQLTLDGKLACVSLDVETCGHWMTQLSAQLHGLGGVGKKQQDTDKDAIIQETFNEHVKPPPNTRWSRASKDVTGLHPNHPNTTNADALEVVWEKITNHVNKHIGKDERGLLVA